MSFTARRTTKPRKIAQASDSEDDRPTPVLAIRKKAASSKKSASRLSFFGEGGDPTDADTSEPAFMPKKSALSRKAIERNAAKRALGIERLSIAPQTVSYSREDLEELRRGQMVTPTTTATEVEEEEDTVMVDLTSQGIGDVDMGEAGAVIGAGQTQIMDEGLVRVMKTRRRERAAAAKAGANDFMSLHDDASDDASGELMIRSRKKKERRLARREDFDDDEEIAIYVDDAERVLLTNSGSARREQARRRKQAIRETIAEAEGADDEGEESDVSKDSLVEEWERDQIRKGVFGDRGNAPRGLDGELEALARNPPAVTPLPEMSHVVRKLEATLKAMEIRKDRTEKQIEALVAEKKKIRDREQMVQARLKEAAAQYERLRKETGVAPGSEGVVSMDRGLESFGSTPITAAVEE
ncbi:nineteen complex-related protein 2-domain-containing protein [Sphaerosporella brunnea]|uniref:Nineteen complex-related protein 2-domain-containing protein n=1 Tax=Sphaerosporella brunnea TaxID=1250544 RepID=A0A5J5EWE5_9PEZI|nr:nineteen complex-related protein 2-domain-containing protein [Sphaerosporella brunnea]